MWFLLLFWRFVSLSGRSSSSILCIPFVHTHDTNTFIRTRIYVRILFSFGRPLLSLWVHLLPPGQPPELWLCTLGNFCVYTSHTQTRRLTFFFWGGVCSDQCPVNWSSFFQLGNPLLSNSGKRLDRQPKIERWLPKARRDFNVIIIRISISLFHDFSLRIRTSEPFYL